LASEYAAAGDVDPRVGEHLLDVLALDGIAAYLRPSSDLHPVTRTNLLPGRPTDRLYVDRVHVATARAYLAQLAAENTPGGTGTAAVPGTGQASDASEPPNGSSVAATSPQPDIDDAWAAIVANFDADGRPRPAWPDPEDTPEGQPGRIGPGRSRLVLGGRTAPPGDEPSLLDGLDTFGADLPDAEEEDFTPPPAPPMPRPSAAAVLAVIGIVGGLTVFLHPALLPTSAGLAMFVGFTALLGGFAALVWRLRPGGGDDERDPDDGARV
jgi:hypothetical protein